VVAERLVCQLIASAMEEVPPAVGTAKLNAFPSSGHLVQTVRSPKRQYQKIARLVGLTRGTARSVSIRTQPISGPPCECLIARPGLI
jgi:hypothetical protein